ncbi:MAG: class I adenylate-forming enzyme family protein [Kineosporiaceae bacterium]
MAALPDRGATRREVEDLLRDVERGVPAGPGVAAARAAGMGAALAALPPGRLVLPTSGSTSHPRLVVRTVSSWTASFAAFTAVSGLGGGGEETVWAPGPASSTMTLFASWHALASGWSLRADGPWRGVPDADLSDVTSLHAVPAVADQVLAAVEEGRLPALRTIVVAGAASPAGLRERARRLGVATVEYYGAAELSFVAIDPDGGGLTPFPQVRVRARRGCLEVASPWTCQGYLAGDGPLVHGDDGWAGVGDRGEWDGERVRVHGRGGGVTVGGVTVHLADVESVLRRVPGVADVVAVAVDSPHLGGAVAAVVEPVPSHDPGPLRAALYEAARKELVPAARPRRHGVAPLARTTGGKADRARVAALLAAG